MLTAERHALLLDRLRSEGRIVAKSIAAELRISKDTIRRDLRDLAAAGLCQRVYGGALPASEAVADYATRRGLNPDGKDRVARAAAALIQPGQTVILDGGTTTLAVVRQLPHDLVATIVTHSPTIAVALVEHPSVDVFLIGGRLFKHSAVASGASAVEAAAGVNADLFLLGVTGVHESAGFTTGDADEAAMKRALARRAADTYVLADADKVGAASPFEVLPIGEVAGLVTDADPASPTVAALRETGLAIVGAG